MKATLIKTQVSGGGADQKVWQLDPPFEHGRWNEDDEWVDVSVKYAVTSATVVPYSGPETYIFQAWPDGQIRDIGQELPGSYRGGLDHELCLTYNGYEVIQ